MGNEWNRRPLCDLTENFDSIRIPVKEKDRAKGPYPYYGASGIVDYVDNYLFDGEYLLIAEDGENLRTRNTPIAFIAEGKFWVNNHAHIVRGNSTANTRFLMYAMAATDISGYLTGSTMPKLTQANMNRIPVVAPPLAEQKAIAYILGTLDDKIEVNRRMNETLEGMARALFKSWFVDFDPVLDNALAAGNPIPEEFRDRAAQRADAATSAASHGRRSLPNPLAAQFPNAFHDSDLGPIPEGWEVGKIELCCERIQNGGTPKRSNPEFWSPPTISWLTSGEVRQSIIITTESRISELGLNSSSAKWLPEGATVVALYGATAGQVALLAKRLTTNQAICGLVPRAGFRYFIYLALSNLSSEMARQARGSAQQNISKQIVQNVALTIPPKDTAGCFDEVVTPLFDRWIANLKNNESLAALRDTLLPKLLSGELRVNDAEKFVERCV